MLAALLGGDLAATRHAVMLGAGDPRGKYLTRQGALTPRQLAAHLAGEITLAGYLVARDGRARLWALDVDEGGPEAVRARVEALTAAGLPCIGLAVAGAGTHNGGHIWGRYAEGVEPAAAAAQVRAIVEAAGLATAEIWPSGKAIRLPLGVHRHTGRRGMLLRHGLPDVELDTTRGLAEGLAALLALEVSPAPSALAAPAPRAQQPARPAERLTEGEGSPIERFNAEHTVEELLDRYGATRTRDGWACNCGLQHDHKTQLVVTGQGRAVFFSTRCGWAPARTDRNGRPIADAFDLFAQVEHRGDKRAAVAALLPARQPRKARPAPPPPGEYPEAESVAWRSQEAARKRGARRAEAQATLQAVRDRAAEDLDLSPADRAVLRALLDVAGERAWCRPSKARLVELTGYSLGAVKRSLMRLETLGYFASEGDGGGPNDTAVRTFLRGSSGEAAQPEMIHESCSTCDLETLDHEHVRGGGPSPDDGDAQVDADVERVLARRAEAQQLAALGHLVAELAAAAGVTLPAELPTAIAELEALAEQLLAAADAGPITAAGPVTFADGASFTPPADDLVVEASPAPRRRRLRDAAGLEWHLAQLRELDRYRAEQLGQVEPAQVEASPREPALVKGPPRSDRARRTYFGLLGKAKHATSAKQRSCLRAQAAALEEWYTPAELQADRERRAAVAVEGRAGPALAPPSPAPESAQLDLFAYSPPAILASCSD